MKKWFAKSGLPETALRSNSYQRNTRSGNDALNAKKAGNARDVQIARWLETNNGSNDDAASMWGSEVRVGMTQEQVEITNKLVRLSETTDVTQYKAHFFDWFDGREIAQPAFAQLIMIDRQTKTVVVAKARYE